MTGRSTSATGREGEHIAREFLHGKGLSILAMNYRCERAEVDIVAQEGDVLVFCEVKMRRNDHFGPPELAITQRKQRQVRQAALGYLAEHGIQNRICRFDVVAIEKEGDRFEIRHWKDAF
jgi:putative endonuclease